MSANINIFIVEDEAIIAEDIIFSLQERGYTVLGNSYSKEAALDFLNQNNPDIALLDINLGKGNEGIEIGQYLSSDKDIPFIFLTSYSDKLTIDKAKLTHPMGYITKPIDFNSLYSTIEIALYNYSRMLIHKTPNIDQLNKQLLSPITKKEFDVLIAIYEGKNNKQIAEHQFVSINTVKTHIKNLYEKLNVHSRSELLAKIRQAIS